MYVITNKRNMRVPDHGLLRVPKQNKKLGSTYYIYLFKTKESQKAIYVEYGKTREDFVPKN